MTAARSLVILGVLFLSGCAGKHSRGGVMSQELPLTVGDIADIKAGEKNHEAVLEEYKVFTNVKLETYLDKIASDLAKVSSRPNLPYKAVILDSTGVDIFGGPGGYIYITRGMLEFVRSESEIAAIFAHEISHIAGYDYSTVPHGEKIKKVYNALLKGSEFASETVGSYGTAANKGLRTVGKVAPQIKKRFDKDEELLSDKSAVEFIIKAGYDPRAFQEFITRLAKVPMQDIGRFVNFMNAHPPFPERQKVLKELIQGKEFEKASLEIRPEILSELNPPPVLPEVPPADNILFESPARATFEADQVERDKSSKLGMVRKQRSGWF